MVDYSWAMNNYDKTCFFFLKTHIDWGCRNSYPGRF